MFQVAVLTRAMADRGPFEDKPRMPYSPGIDGLRALAVLAVVAYHLDIEWFRGGFMGVEMFFAVSGYLITALLLHELDTTGSLSLRKFWRRRVRRLLPSLAITVAGLAAWVAIVDPDAWARFQKEVLAAIGYVSNWFFIVREESYFDAFERPSPLRHLWSLAIEEQFYLLWPLMVLAGALVLGRRGLLLATGIGIIASTVLMGALHDELADPTRVYFGTDTRAAGLLIGAALAMVWRPWEQPRSPKRAYRLSTVGLFAMAGLVWSVHAMGEYDARTYQGGFLVVSVLTSVVVAAVVTRTGWLGRVLGWRPLVWIGVRSYAMYLVHWPVVVYTRPGSDIGIHGLALLAYRIVLIVVLTEAVHRLVEMPIRNRDIVLPNVPRRRVFKVVNRRRFGLAIVGLVMIVSASAAVITALDPGDGVDPTQPAEGAAAAVLPVTQTSSPPTTLAESPGPTTDTTPLPTDATSSTSTPTTPATSPSPTTTTEAPVIAAEPEPPTVLVIGDSVALGAKADLEATDDATVFVDAVVGRQFVHAAEVLEAYMAFGLELDALVLHLGTNGPFTAEDFDEVLATAGPDLPITVVNVKVPRPWADRSNDELSAGAERYANVTLLDWKTQAEANDDWLISDGTHLTAEGSASYSELVTTAVTEPVPPPTPE